MQVTIQAARLGHRLGTFRHMHKAPAEHHVNVSLQALQDHTTPVSLPRIDLL
jgi:hypothetical protein